MNARPCITAAVSTGSAVVAPSSQIATPLPNVVVSARNATPSHTYAVHESVRERMPRRRRTKICVSRATRPRPKKASSALRTGAGHAGRIASACARYTCPPTPTSRIISTKTSPASVRRFMSRRRVAAGRQAPAAASWPDGARRPPLPRLRDRPLHRRAGRARAREAPGGRAGARHRRHPHLHPLRRSRRDRRVAGAGPRLSVDLRRGGHLRDDAGAGRLPRRGPRASRRHRPHHRDGRARRVPARRSRRRGRGRAGRRAGDRDLRDPRLQAADARRRRPHRPRRPLRRSHAARRDLHRAAGAAGPQRRSVGRPQSLPDVVARDPDLGPLAGRLRRDALARPRPRRATDGLLRRARVFDGGDALVRASQPRRRRTTCTSRTRSPPASCSRGR